jgi:RNA polymerase sigma factor (sigma-70 family)
VEASALSHPVGLGRLSVAGPLLRLRSDDQLVALFRAGHDEAFGVIHDRYRQRLFAYSRQMLGGSRSDAEDVLQDVFLRAYHALRADGRPLTLRAWLYRVAHNRCIDQLRRPNPAAADIFDLNRGVHDDPTDAAERREDLRRLVEDVRRLPEQQRSALLMREMEGLSYTELADALGVTVPAIKSLLVRARIGLVEAVEARDTACTDIRADLIAAADRGVRASGRSRKHLRECQGCREYRSAMRRVEKQLNGLSPSHGPLTTLAKVLGIGGAGSGAAAGGGAAVGGGGAAAVAGGGGMATIGGGAVAATATKVAAVVAAAAVVGGGAATVREQQAHHQAAKPAAVVRTLAPAAPSASAAQALAHHAAQTSAGATTPAKQQHHDAATKPAVTPSVATLDPAGPVDSTPSDEVPVSSTPVEQETNGGLKAPDDTTPETGVPANGSPASEGSSTSGETSSGTTGDAPTGTPAGGTATGTGTSSADGAGATGAPAGSETSSGPTGQVSTTSDGSPVAQGASVSDH